jgi:type III restriction enzyme
LFYGKRAIKPSDKIDAAKSEDRKQAVVAFLSDHLYLPQDGSDFKVELGEWERGVVLEEIERGAAAWLRNLDRKKWSLEIPYEFAGASAPMFPDLLVVRAVAHKHVFDILEPHDPSRNDDVPKAIGFAKFAEKHPDRFRRIELIRKERSADRREHFRRLDMNKLGIQNKVCGIESNSELDRIFDEDGMFEQ